MLDILKGLLGGNWSVLVAWIFPAALAVSLIALVAYPMVDGLQFAAPIRQLHLDAATAGLIVAGAAVALGLLMNASSTFLYRVLEGYAWPSETLKELRQKRHTTIRYRLSEQAEIEAQGRRERAKNEPPGRRERTLNERLRRYPPGATPTMPTAFGNAMYSIEHYGVDRWGLNSQVLWSHLLAVAPSTVGDEIESARAGVSFWVCAYFNTLLFASASVSAVLIGWRAGGRWNTTVLLVGVGSLLLLWPCYRGAVSATTAIRVGVQALVDLGRKPLLDALGLSLPPRMDDERYMWGRISSWVFYEYTPERAEQLQRLRMRLFSRPVSSAAGLAQEEPAAKEGDHVATRPPIRLDLSLLAAAGAVGTGVGAITALALLVARQRPSVAASAGVAILALATAIARGMHLRQVGRMRLHDLVLATASLLLLLAVLNAALEAGAIVWFGPIM